jgi:hypothetical protein
VDIEKAIENHIKANVSLVVNRVYPEEEPEINKDYPVIIYQLISGVDDHSLGIDSDSTEERWQFTIKAKTPGSRSAVAKQLKAAFKDFSGLLGGANGKLIQTVLQVGRQNFRDDETKIFLRMEDFMFIYDDN